MGDIIILLDQNGQNDCDQSKRRCTMSAKRTNHSNCKLFMTFLGLNFQMTTQQISDSETAQQMEPFDHRDPLVKRVVILVC